MSKNHKKLSILDRLAIRNGFPNHNEYLHSQHWKDYKKACKHAGLPMHCVVCDYPKCIFYYLTRENYGKEKLGDVIPLCLECFNISKKADVEIKFPNPTQSIMKVFTLRGRERTDDAIKNKLLLFQPYWNNRIVVNQIPPPNTNPLPRYKNDFGKISGDLNKIKKYLENGYTPEQIGKIYNVGGVYVRQYISKYPEYFQGIN